MLHLFHNNQNGLSYQNLRNKTTVKKEKNFTNNLNRFNLISGKQNQYNQSNIITHNIKTIQRKNNQNEQQEQTDKICANHLDKDAEFIVKIEGETLNYCRKCATHIASQGFQVQKISQKNQKISAHRRLTLNQNRSPNCLRQNQTLNTSRKLQLTEFTRKLKNLRADYEQKGDQLVKICQSYQIEKQNISNYYSSLIQYIQDMRDTHLQAIQEQSINNTQICDIQAGQVQQTINQIDSIVHDIQSNLQNIVSQVDDDNYIECLSFYRQKQGIFNHRLQQLGAEAKPWNCTEQKQLTNKFESFKTFLDNLHGLHQEDQSSVQNQKQERYGY